MGRGDVKLAVVLGAGLGWLVPVSLATAELVVWALLGANGLGLLQATLGAAARRVQGDASGYSLRRTAIPFGPPMSAAAVGVVLLGDRLLR